jgi:hypothetical protein
MVGDYSSPDGVVHGYKLVKGVFTTIDYPEATVGSSVRSINILGAMVGVWAGDNYFEHGFQLSPRGFVRIDIPGTLETSPQRITTRGVIVGIYTDADGNYHGFVRTPADNCDD